MPAFLLLFALEQALPLSEPRVFRLELHTMNERPPVAQSDNLGEANWFLESPRVAGGGTGARVLSCPATPVFFLLHLKPP